MSSAAASKTGGRVLGGYFVLLAIFLYAPLAVMIIFAFNDSFVQTFPWSGFTTKWFHNAFSNEELIGALKRSLWIGILAAILATLLGLITAVGMTARKLRLRGLITALVLLPLVIPYIVLAVGMLILLNWLGLQRTLVAVLLGHVAVSVPYCLLIILPRLRTLDQAIVDAARDLGATDAADRARRHDDRAAHLLADGARVQRDGGGPVARPLSLTMFATALVAGKKAAGKRPSTIIGVGFALLTTGLVLLVPIVPRADSGWALLIPLVIAGVGMGLLVSQLNNYTLAPVSEDRVSEAAGVNSAGGSFGLAFGLAFAGAIMLATLSFSFTNLAESSNVLTPAEQQQVGDALEHNAEVMTNTQLQKQLAGRPQQTQDEIISINTDARHRALQVALLIPILAGLAGLFTSFRMMRIPEPEPSAAAEGMALG